MDGQRHEGWREGPPDLLWMTVGKGACQHSLQMQVKLLGAIPPGTRLHLNSASPGVEVGGSQTLGGSSVGGATAIAATVAIVVVTVVLLLAGQL
jgi:hypothetical protein